MSIVFLDPGGDAVQAIGHFNVDGGAVGTGVVSFDSAQEVVGVGSYKFDSGASGDPAYVTVLGVLGASRRISCYFRYNSVPDTAALATETPVSNAAYSAGGFAFPTNLYGDEGVYGTATPAKNAGQGTIYSGLDFDTALPQNADIDSVKIIYERKYDTADSVGISRVKIRVDGVEGPDHDNTDEPTTDTVVTVDVTADRPAWERQDLLDGVFEVIAEARRGDSDTSHTQSWDYVKVEVGYHLPVTVLAIAPPAGQWARIALTPRGSGVVLRFIDAEFNGYDGTTELAVDTWNRISFGLVFNGVDDLDIKMYVNGVEELSITAAALAAVVQFYYGWIAAPGANIICWFDQIYIDDGSDLNDPGNVLITAKLPAAVNEDNWATDGGTGAINERPLSDTNYKEQQGDSVRQTYTLQTAAVGDVDISSETLVGYMGWAKAATGDFSEVPSLVLNNLEYAVAPLDGLNFLPDGNFLKQPITSDSYPSHAAGIGMLSDDSGGDTILVECGAVVAYEGLVEGNALLPHQQLAIDTVTNVSDITNLGATYALRSEVDPAVSTVVTTTISSSTGEGEVPQQQAIIESNGGDEIGVTVVAPGQEVTASVAVEGATTNVELRRAS